MCDPVMLGLLAVQAGGAVVKAVGTYKAGEATAEGEDFRAEILGINADIAESNVGLLRTQADIVRQGERVFRARGLLNETKIAEEGRKVLASQRVAFADRNLDPTFGSPLLLQARTAGQIAADVEMIRAGTEVEVAEVKTRAANIEAQAAAQSGAAFTATANQMMSGRRASSARMASILGAGTALLSGFGGLAGQLGGGGTPSGGFYGGSPETNANLRPY